MSHRKITFVVNNYFLITASGINTFLLHLKQLCALNNIEITVYDTIPNRPNSLTRELMRTKHDIVITNDLDSVLRCAHIKCNLKINYLHIGDVHAFGHPDFKYNDMGANYVYEYLNALLDETVYVSQRTQCIDLQSRKIKHMLLPMPFYPTPVTVQDKAGLISIMPDCPRKNLDFCLECPSNIPFTYVGATNRLLPSNFKNIHVDNSQIAQLIANHKALLLPSHIDTYGYVLLEAVQHTRPILLKQRWNAELLFDKVETVEEVIQLMNEPYKPVFDINEYSKETERQWIALFNEG
ncbi:TPA: hypothetical protein SIA39_004236 [Aeromonas sobria]|nr:hypothetical protein [Aeromonas sobria]